MFVLIMEIREGGVRSEADEYQRVMKSWDALEDRIGR